MRNLTTHSGSYASWFRHSLLPANLNSTNILFWLRPLSLFFQKVTEVQRSATQTCTCIIALGTIVSALSFDAPAQCHFLSFSYESNNTNPVTNPGIPVVADFNRDGKADAAWPNSELDNITIALGNGMGDFSSVFGITVGNLPTRLMTGDFNRDTRPDLAVNGLTTVLLGTGNGGFVAGPANSLMTNATAVADFNRDGIDDILTTSGSSFRVFLGDGTGAFTPQTTVMTDGQNTRFTVGDINRDGRADIAITQFFDGRVAIFLGNATGFGTQTNVGVGSSPTSAKLADVNNDLRLDLIVGRRISSMPLAVLLGNGTGTFGAVSEYDGGFGPDSVAVGDFNGDGKTDVVTGTVTGGSAFLKVVPNNGNGTFGMSRSFFSGGGPHNVAVADFNNDGKDDIFSTEQDTDTFGVLRNTCTGRLDVDPDFTGDDKADISVFRPSTGVWFVLRSEDNSFFSFPFGANGDVPAPADYDGDRKTDVAVFRPSTGTWFIQRSTGGTIITQFGANGDVPMPNDYDGDEKADLAIYRPSNGEWWLLRSTTGLIALQFGAPGDIPVR